MRYSLRTLLILLTVVPPLLAFGLPLLLLSVGFSVFAIVLAAIFSVVLVVPAIGIYACWDKRGQSG